MTAPRLGRPVGASGEDTRRRIITAAMRCVAQVGYSRTTIREIAKTAGITSANLYNYFPNKADLISAAIAARAELALPRLQRAAAGAGTPADRIEAVLDESGALMREYPDLAAFEWAIRAQNVIAVYPDSDDKTGLHAIGDIIAGIVADAYPPARRSGRAGAAAALNALVYGLTELAATGSPQTYQATLHAAKQLLRGQSFEPEEV